MRPQESRKGQIGVKSSLLAGLGTGVALVAAASVTATFVFPPEFVSEQVSPIPEAPLPARPDPVAEGPVPERPEDLPEETEATSEPGQPIEDAPEMVLAPGSGVVPDPEGAPEPAETAAPEIAPEPQDLAESADVPEMEITAEPLAAEPAPLEPGPVVPEMMTDERSGAGPVADDAPMTPAQEVLAALAELPEIRGPQLRPEAELMLPDMPPPALTAPAETDAQPTPPEPEAAPEEQPHRSLLAPTGGAMPGRPAASLIPLDPDPAAAEPEEETPAPLVATALARNSLYDGQSRARARMALVLNDPGLPTPLRRDLAAMDFPFTVALNPMDTSAQAAAEIYFEGGKEVVILAAGLPAGATPSDIDVSLTSYLDMFPQAIGMIDLPDEGFARNAQLLRGVLPYLAADGHGLITFAGGLSQVATATQAAGVAHAEVFRVLDDGDHSPFAIRRFLDRAVFQASQMGHVIVFGDATNDATMEAIAMWREEGRVGQVALTPVSAILLARE